MSQYFLKPYEIIGGDISVKVDLCNYATKADLKNATGIDTFKLAAKSDLANLKSEIDKIDIGKSRTAPIDLGKLSNVVNNNVVKTQCMINQLLKNIDTSEFVLKTKYNRDKLDLEKNSDVDKKVPDTSGLAKKTNYNAKITEIESKKPNITGYFH